MMIDIVYACLFVVGYSQWMGSRPHWRSPSSMSNIYLDPEERAITGSRFEYDQNNGHRGREGALCNCQGMCGYGRGGTEHLMFANNKKSGARGCHWCGHGQYDPSQGNHDKIVYCYTHVCDPGYVSICDQSLQLGIHHSSYSRDHRACTCTKAAGTWVLVEPQANGNTYETSYTEYSEHVYSVTDTETYAIETSVNMEIEGVGGMSSTVSNEFSTAIENSWTQGSSSTVTVSTSCGDGKNAAWQYAIFMYDVMCVADAGNSWTTDPRFLSEENANGCAVASFLIDGSSGLTCTASASEPPCCFPGYNPPGLNDRKFCTDYTAWTGQCDGYGSRVRSTSIEDGNTCYHSDCPALDDSGLAGHIGTCGATCGNNAVANVFVPSDVFNQPNMLECNDFPSWSQQIRNTFCSKITPNSHVVFLLSRQCNYAVWARSQYNFDDAYQKAERVVNRRNRNPKLMVPIMYNNWYGLCDHIVNGRRLLENELQEETEKCKCDVDCVVWGDCCDRCMEAMEENFEGASLSKEEWEFLGPLRQVLEEEEFVRARDAYYNH